MTKDNILLGLVLKQLDCFSLDSFKDRLLIQKKIYFAQRFGLPLGYHFSWYMRGPYSTGLTNGAYDVIPEGDKVIAGYTLSEPAGTILRRVLQLGEHPNKVKAGLEDEQWFELLASIDYLRQTSAWITDKSNNGVFTLLHEAKPQFTRQQFDLAYQVLTENNLLAAG